jgi:spore germination protein KC
LRRTIGFAIGLMVMSVMLTACWDRTELNNLAIVVGMGFDNKGENQIEVSTQIVNPGEVASKTGGGGGASPVTTLSATAVTTSEAIRELSTVSPRKVFRSHLRILVIGEALAREGIIQVMDGLSRNHEVRSDFYIIVAKGAHAKDVLEILTPLEKIPSNSMFSRLDMSSKIWAPTVKMQLDEVIADLHKPEKGMVLTGIRILGDPGKGKTMKNKWRSDPYSILKYSGLALFKEGKLVDWLNSEESKGYNYIMNNVVNSVGHLACPGGGEIAVDVTRTKSMVKGKTVGGRPEITVDLKVEENIYEVQCDIDVTKTENIERLETIANEKLASIMESAIRKAQKNKSDIFGFGNAIEDAEPKAWMKLKKDWDEYFADLKVQVQVDTNIHRLGTINNSLMEKE